MLYALTESHLTPNSIPGAVHQSRHATFITDVAPGWLTSSTAEQRSSLKSAAGPAMPWYDKASVQLRDEMKRAFELAWFSRRESDKAMKKLQGSEFFAESILIAALKDRYNINVNVRSTCLRLYSPKGIVVGFDVRTLSLLEASLQNFELKETRAGYFDKASDFITQPSEIGHFEVVPIKSRLSVEGFIALCRELDIGAKYQAYIKEFIGLSNPVAQALLKHRIQSSHKDAMRAASVMALMKQDIDLDVHRMILKLVEGHRTLMLRGKPMQCFGLTMMDIGLSDIVLITAGSDRSGTTEQIIAYVPHDPQHPLKQYSSSVAFAAELATQLRTAEYQRFFSRFVPHRLRGMFFFQLNDKLSKVQWHQPIPFDQAPAWRAEPVSNPHLRMGFGRIDMDFWTYDFHQKLNKILNDARAMAVPTGDEDAKSRWARWDSLQKTALGILEVAAFVAAPFVPLLGELMLAYTAYQVLDETFEGIIEWSEGQRTQAAEHLVGVVESVIQLAGFAVGGKVVGELLPFKPSPFVERMKVVEMSNGQSKLWRPDLDVYELPITLGDGVRPDSKGIYRHEGRDVLALDSRHYVVRQEPRLGKYSIQHPTRADAYSPRLAHNGVGAWTHESERPETWRGATLMRRLGHRVESFTDQTLERIRIVSGVEDDVLRKVHVEHERPPALLIETIRRFKADQDVQTFIEQTGSDAPNVYGQADWKTQLDLLTRYGKWPESRAVELLDRDGNVLWQYLPESAANPPLPIRATQTDNNDLARTLLLGLDEPNIKSLLDEEVSIGRIALDVRAARLRAVIAGLAKNRKSTSVDARYRLMERADDTDTSEAVQLLRNEFVQLPRTVIDDLLINATPTELLQMREGRQIPLRLRQAGRAAMLELRILRSYEGLFLESSENLDTVRLALHSVERLPGWSPDLRIEIRGLTFDGPLLDSVGPADSFVRKVLVLSDEGGFEAYDAEGNSLHGIDDFYTSILQALPDSSRKELGFQIGQSARLKQALQMDPLAQNDFRKVLLRFPIRKPAYDPAVMRLRGGMQGYEAMETEQNVAPSLAERFKTLYPGSTKETYAAFIQSFTSEKTALAAIGEREKEFAALNKALDSWVAIERGEHLPMDQRYHKGRFAKALKQCWQAAEGPGAQGYALDLDFHWPSDFLEYLPALNAKFDHVSSLQFRHVELRTDISDFLDYFPKLRALDLSDNALVAPPRLRDHSSTLENLDFSNNQLVLTAESVADLGSLTRLQTLKLSGNPLLSQLPDISRMAELSLLDLHDTGIAQWPTGLFTLPRPLTFELDLQGNPIEHVPQVTAGSEQARLVARTRLSRDQLSDQGREQFHDYMRSVGYDPARSYPPKGTETSVYWLEGLSGEQRENRQLTWDELEREPDAQGFFEVLEQLTESADYAEDTSRTGLTQRVWRMLDAVSENTPLREELFRMATHPDSCADAGAQIFNEMGIKVLVHEALRAGTSEQIEAGLVRLAKGKSRLDQVNEIARATIQTRLQAGETFMAIDEDGDITGTIDEVEVYLAFQTGLADRLELPWQSRGMLFREMSEVSDAQIGQAYESILALEVGDGLLNRIIEQRFWRKYLKSRFTQAFEQNANEYNAKSGELLNRQSAGEISQEVYEHELLQLSEGRKTLLKTLTQEALKIA
ncbi:NEL-type E3 ubiquitin ligase domain-containing protein [Pseudomonas sp. O230]|uniref:NEL-type E3 ubiquitin ligase domain-containing protein n=1 Tax=Pseudomonas sp. O230 TaxID=3159450 RepID=UPI00387B90A9